jgi:hypothetical protein
MVENPSNGIENHAYKVGHRWGLEAATYAKLNYPEVINNAEVESDLSEIMGDFWNDFEKEILVGMPDFPSSSIQDGWSDGFLDIVFPLRHMV